VVPLAYEAPAYTKESRSLKPRDAEITVLFLGQVILRKGIGQLFDAIRLLSDAPIRFVIAGPLGVKVPQDVTSNPRVTFTGAVDGATARKLYQQADVFILPTLSDGFAITQLEALAYGVPVIASRFCGEVVKHEETGLLLDRVTGASIAEALLGLTQGDLLAHMQANATVPTHFQLAAVGNVIYDII
jgi:glycosyltransferase involved in cell wall biosynthesis